MAGVGALAKNSRERYCDAISRFLGKRVTTLAFPRPSKVFRQAIIAKQMQANRFPYRYCLCNGIES